MFNLKLFHFQNLKKALILAVLLNSSAHANSISCSKLFNDQAVENKNQQAQEQRKIFGLTTTGIIKPKDVASFLAWVKTYIPELYHNTKDFPVNFWEAVRERNSLEELLKEFPVYHEYLKHKNHLTKVRIQSKKQSAYQFDIDKLHLDCESDFPNELNIASAHSELVEIEKLKGLGSSSLLLTDLMFKVEGADRKAIAQSATIETLSEYFSKKGTIPDSFRGQNHGLAQPWSVQKIQQRYFEIVEFENKIAKLKKFIFYKENVASTKIDNNSIAELANALKDKGLKAALEPYLIKITDSAESALSKVDITLQEIPDSLAMFKSCVGIDCTPPRFAALPSERAFFIYDSDNLNDPKGYLSVAEIKSKDGRKLLYFKQFQGPRIGVEKAQAILLVAHQIAEAMGYEGAVISSRPHSNYSVLWQPWQDFVDRTNEALSFNFSDHTIRSLFDVEPNDKGGIHHSEAMGNTSEIFPIHIPEYLSKAKIVATAENNPIKPVTLGELSTLDRIEAGIAYARFMDGKPQGEKANVFFQLDLNQEDMQRISQLLKNPGQYNRKEFEDNLLLHCRTKSNSLKPDEVQQHFKYLIQANQMRFKDSFSAILEAENITPLIQRVKAIRNQGEYMFRDLVNLSGQPIPLLKRKILDLTREASDIDKMKIVSWLIYILKPEHFTPEFVTELLTSVQTQMTGFNQAYGDDGAKVRENNKNSGYFRIMSACYPHNKELVTAIALKLQAPWKLGYYMELPVGLRAQAPAFKNSLLWNLRETGQDGNRWYLNGQLSISELASLLNGDLNEVDRFTETAVKQVSEKIYDSCRGAGNVACGSFLLKYTPSADPKSMRDLVKETMAVWQK